MNIKLRGRIASKGRAHGAALVCHEPLSFRDVEPTTGVIYQPGHELHGRSLKDKVVVKPSGCGSTGYHLYLLKMGGGGPKAIVNISSYHHEIIDAIFAQIPMVYGFGHNLLEIVQTGDYVDVNADNGIVTVTKE